MWCGFWIADRRRRNAGLQVGMFVCKFDLFEVPDASLPLAALGLLTSCMGIKPCSIKRSLSRVGLRLAIYQHRISY